ncbi:MAG: protein phosphatase 2C domain-containing protein, partial [Planctomycetota bacterium]|nr:protein phosphatase 2C domain-containing protein [Planctomycetota bacterium]
RNNQDSYAVQIAPDSEAWESRGHLFLVADGMGGHAVGELASKIAADTIPHTYSKLLEKSPSEALCAAVIAGNAAINERGELNRDFTRMGTTCTTLVLYNEGAVVAHVGDSRCYRIRGGKIDQLTFDHSLQWELLKQGTMSPEEIFRNEPRNVITRSLGPGPQVEVDVEGPFDVEAQDVYLLCSDGLTGQVSDPEIGAIAGSLAPADACRMLVNLANLRGGPDNITVVVARVGPLPEHAQEWSSDEIAAIPRRSLAGWRWILAWVAVVSAFLVGLVLVPTSLSIAGHLLMAAANLACGGLILFRLRQRRTEQARSLVPEMAPGKPYRTASAELTPQFLGEIAALESALQRTAQDDGWAIDWAQYDTTFQQAKTHLAAKRHNEALRLLSKGLQLLMEGIQQIRKQRDQALRWGVRPSQPGSDPGAPRPGGS